MLYLHRADRADHLVAALSEVLAAPLDDCFEREAVAVPTRGVERWLTQRLSGHLGAAANGGDGVCANVEFPSPRRMLDEVLGATTGFDADMDPWSPRRAVWPLMEILEASKGQVWLARLTEHLAARGGDRSRKFRSIQHIAGLFDRYALYRPQMLGAWAQGRDEDGAGRPLDEDHCWQAEAWRRLAGSIAASSPVERVELACVRLSSEPEMAGLPGRVSLFGITNLPPLQLQLLRSLSTGRDVHLFFLQPSQESWATVAQQLADSEPVVSRATVPLALVPANPLLATWGRDARELQLVLDASGGADHDRQLETAAGDASLLERLQADVRADRAPSGARTAGSESLPVLGDGDLSVQVHACHGRARQVEVLRDTVLHALEAAPTLEPRDVIVMCPDIESFAPLIEATFGAADAIVDSDDGDPIDESGVHPAGLQVRLADRAMRQTNPVLGVVARLLELVPARVTASEVLDLADREPVRRRFRFGQDDLSRMQDWVKASGIHWGFDADHRKPFQMGQVHEGTWRFGLDRVVTGVAMSEEDHRLFAEVLPLDDVDSSAIDLAGRFAEYVDRLQASLDALRASMPIDGWVEAIANAADSLVVVTGRDAWQRAELQRVLVDIQDEATMDGEPSPVALDVADVAALLGDRLAGRPTRANFRTGHLTVCTLQPMRSVPHRVVCLLGLDDLVFPRHGPRDGDDLLLADPHVGDRDARSEDRQILLDALMATTDRLVITYTGNDERTNAHRAPAVPVAELLDVIDRTVTAPDGGSGRDGVVVHHPLQPFDARNFEVGAIVPDRPWSFDAVTLEGAKAMLAERVPRRPFLAEPLPALDRQVVDLDDLVSFLGHPIRAFLTQRLGIAMNAQAEKVDDDLPVELDQLAKWNVGKRLLETRLAGADRKESVAAEWARGALPPGKLGATALARINPAVEAVLAVASNELDLDRQGETIDVRVSLGDGRMLGGTIVDLCGDVVQTVTFARINAKHRLGAWVRCLALTAVLPQRAFSAITVGRARKEIDAQVTLARIPPPAGDASARREYALRQIEMLVDLYDRGMREPLPMFRATSAAYASGSTADPTRAREAWTSEFNSPREDQNDAHTLVFGGVRSFDELLAEPPRSDEFGEGWDENEPSRFGRYARRLWGELLAVEELADR